MPEIIVSDECGHGMLMRRTPRGIYMPFLGQEDTVDNFPNFKVRDEDVYLCSFPKAGCHWTWEILRLFHFGFDIEKSKKEKESYMVEICTEKELDMLESPRLLNHHLNFDNLPTQLWESKAKTVYIYRNLKDVAVSFYYHNMKIKGITSYGGTTFSDYLKRFISGVSDSGGNVFDYIKAWDDGLKQFGSRVLVLRYEDMKEDILPQLRRVATFLEMQVDDDHLRRIAQSTEFANMEARMKKIGHKLLIDAEGNHLMYRKGEVGDWKNHFTVAESELFDKLVKEKLGDLTFHKFRYEL